ncbi:tetratricopeptide repeat protein [Noviherbaspirillum sp.]|jgi:tetratricopeptide (TPR) repeat protein|uniref:tetratricopeptide repeat protein n=1 Tax=Noviherbaspirillum sp. TaxID=1926288 RepID=UPI0025E375A9|nr:tetratricopeptide repeat protein [Noviherbaspirillum sp.]
MKLFARDDEVMELEAELPSQRGADQLKTLVALSWHLRQRNTRRALALGDAARVLLTHIVLPEYERLRIDARLLLVRGEAKWLFGRLDEAEERANEALRIFTLLDDGVGIADAHWLLGFIANERGDQSTCIAELAFSARACSAVDGLRCTAAKFALARLAVLLDRGAAQARWSSHVDAPLSYVDPSLEALADDFRTTLAFESGDFKTALATGMRTYGAALATGQIKRAIIVSARIGTAFSKLGKLDSALEWMQRGLELARSADWPISTGWCLVNTGNTLQMLDQPASALNLLNEALDILKPFPASEVYTIALRHKDIVTIQLTNYTNSADGDNPHHPLLTSPFLL